MICFAVEIVGLLLTGIATAPWMAKLACSSPEPVFAGLPGAGCGGGESRAAAESGAALATYTVFMDMSLGITGPLAGLVMAGQVCRLSILRLRVWW